VGRSDEQEEAGEADHPRGARVDGQFRSSGATLQVFSLSAASSPWRARPTFAMPSLKYNSSGTMVRPYGSYRRSLADLVRVEQQFARARGGGLL